MGHYTIIGKGKNAFEGQTIYLSARMVIHLAFSTTFVLVKSNIHKKGHSLNSPHWDKLVPFTNIRLD